MRNAIYVLLIIAAMTLAACGGAQPAPAPAAAEADGHDCPGRRRLPKQLQLSRQPQLRRLKLPHQRRLPARSRCRR